MAEIQLRNLTKRFEDVIAINNVSLETQDREFLVMLGPSGCGKTTTLRSIAGLEHPQEGDIFIGETRVNGLAPADRDIAFVFQFYALYPHLTVYDNIAFPLKAAKVAKSDIEERVLRVAQMLRIEHILNRKPSLLSGGEMQRVAIGRSMIRRPTVFLMDEPMSNLDAKLRVEMRSELKRLQQQLGTTAIYVTHDQVEAMSMADRIAIMDHGRLKQIGTPEAVYNQPENLFVAGFMGNPSMNLLPCWFDSAEQQLRLEHTEVAIKLESQHIDLIRPAISDQLVFGIRPERAHLSTIPTASNLQAKVHLVEPLGSANIIDILLGRDPVGELVLLRVRTHPTLMPDPGQVVWLHLEQQHVHIFDRVTGEALRSGLD